MENLKMAVQHYFYCGHQYATILDFLSKFHGYHLTLPQLKYLINKKFQLKRRGNVIDYIKLFDIMTEILSGPQQLSGYRTMTEILRQIHGLVIPRDVVMKTMQFLDSDGCAQRRKRKLQRRVYRNPGPNAAIHIDGYDKLKPYGFPISGCIDGISRRVLFLKVVSSNNDPAVIGACFMEHIQSIKGCPQKVQTDCGTENVIIAALQCTFKNDLHNQTKSHVYGSSPHNQRIEAWWSNFRKLRSEWWLGLFQNLVDEEHLEIGNKFHQQCLRFSFYKLLQHELDEVKMLWNTHYIRKCKMVQCLPGVPDQLYFLPENHGAQDFKIPLPDPVIDWGFSKVAPSTEPEFEETFINYINYLRQRIELPDPSTWQGARSLYILLKEHIE